MGGSGVVGAVVFWLYIVFALFFTTVILLSYVQDKRPLKDGRTAHQTRYGNRKLIFTVLAVVSFATMSYHMLNVLILSYTKWSLNQPVSIFNSPQIAIRQLWTWSTASAQFQDFGEAIVADEARFFWSAGSLWMTYINMLYMGVQGRRHRIANLWTFAALAEILPISFTQNLFFLAVLGRGKGGDAEDSTVKSADGSSLLYLLQPFVGLVYATCLFMAPFSDIHLLDFILFARAVLLVTSLAHTKQSLEMTRRLLVPLSILMATVPLARALSVFTIRDTLAAINSHPAVSALGYDLVLSLLSWGVWIITK